MNRRHAALIVLACVLALPIRAEPGPSDARPTNPPPPIDIMAVSPGDLGGGDLDALAGRAAAAYAEESYEEAARFFIRILRDTPGNSGALYNLACCYGLLGAADKAAGFLEAAYRAGFRDLGHIRNDRDFEKVREHEAFTAVMRRLEARDAERKKRQGKLLDVVSPFVGTVRVVEPAGGMVWHRRYPLVVGLHGYGDNSENFAGLFAKRGIEHPFVFVAVQAPYASHGGRRIGFSWHFATEGGDTRFMNASHALDETYVLRVIETVRKHYRIDERRIFLMGFSQGAGQAFSIGMKHPDLFAGVIPIGGWLEPGEHPVRRARKAAESGLFLVCHSPEDRVVDREACETATAFLEEHGIPHAVLEYPGGHSLPKALMEAVAAWIETPGPTAPALPAPAPPEKPEPPSGED